jgi:SAM-dependent methyltransferase
VKEASLSERQRREKEYYEEYAGRVLVPKRIFAPTLAQGRKHWNPYHMVHGTAARNFRESRQRLLDLGCGPGVESLRLAMIGYQVYGVDISAHNVEIAERLAKKYRLEHRTHFTVQVAESLPYPSGFFDVIVGTNILHHVHIEKTIRECARVLGDDGIAIFLEPVQVPLFDRLRSTRLGRWLRAEGKSFERHVTEDERKLGPDDIETIRRVIPRVSVRKFGFLARLSQLVKERREFPVVLDILEQLDDFVFTVFPFLRRFGCYAVLTVRK